MIQLRIILLAAVVLAVSMPVSASKIVVYPGESGSGGADLALVKISLHDYGEFIEDAFDEFRDENYETAFDLLSTSARWGDKLSQFLLALSYLQGLGAPIDNVAGTAWLIVSTESENRRWEDFLRDVREAVSEEENAAADELASRLAVYYGMKATDIRCSKLGSASSRLRPVRCTKKPGISGYRVSVPTKFPL